MKKYALLRKILICVVCTMMLAATLLTPAFAANNGEDESKPIVIDSLPYSITQEFYQVDTGKTEEIKYKDENGNEVTETVPVYDKHYTYYYEYVASQSGRLTVQLKANDVYCSANISVNGSTSASIYTNGTKSAYVDLQNGDTVKIVMSTVEDTKVTMNLTIAEFPKGSKYNPF